MKHSSVYRLSVSALMAALLCVFGPLSLPIGPVPVSLTILVILLSLWLLDVRDAMISLLLYLLLGAVGLPVFSGYAGGFQKLLGPTGGYLIGFIPMLLVSGMIMKLVHARLVPTLAGMALGVLIAYTFGTVWFIIETKSALSYALTVCVLPFIPLDLVKIALSAVIGIPVRRALQKAELIPGGYS